MSQWPMCPGPGPSFLRKTFSENSTQKIAQALGSIDVAIKAVKPDYEPMSAIWEQYPDMPWNNGADKEYNVPWTPVTAENVDALLATRQ